MNKEDEVIISCNGKRYKQVYNENLQWSGDGAVCKKLFRCPYCCFNSRQRCLRPNTVFACDDNHYWAELDKGDESIPVNTITDCKGRATKIEPNVGYTVIFKQPEEGGKIIAVQSDMRMPAFNAQYICQDDAIHPHGSTVYFDYHTFSDPQRIAYVCTDDFFYDFLKDQLVEDWD